MNTFEMQNTFASKGKWDYLKTKALSSRRNSLIQIYRALFQSHVDYALQVWCQKICVNNLLIKLQITAVRLIIFSNPIAHSAPLFNQLKLNTLNELIFIANVKLTYQALNNLLPCALSNVLRLHYAVNNFYTRAQTDNLLKRFEVRTSTCLLYTSPSPRDGLLSRMPSSA